MDERQAMQILETTRGNWTATIGKAEPEAERLISYLFITMPDAADEIDRLRQALHVMNITSSTESPRTSRSNPGKVWFKVTEQEAIARLIDRQFVTPQQIDSYNHNCDILGLPPHVLRSVIDAASYIQERQAQEPFTVNYRGLHFIDENSAADIQGDAARQKPLRCTQEITDAQWSDLLVLCNKFHLPAPHREANTIFLDCSPGQFTAAILREETQRGRG